MTLTLLRQVFFLVIVAATVYRLHLCPVREFRCYDNETFVLPTPVATVTLTAVTVSVFGAVPIVLRIVLYIYDSVVTQEK